MPDSAVDIRPPMTLRRTSLLPGQWSTSESHDELSAVVSTGVVVCLWDGKLGGAGHFALPGFGQHSSMASDRYGDILMENLLSALFLAGVDRSALCATVAGGAFPDGTVSAQDAHLGAQNVEFVLGWLRARGVQVDRRVIGGAHARRVNFNVTTGSFRHELIRPDRPPGLQPVPIVLPTIRRIAAVADSSGASAVPTETSATAAAYLHPGNMLICREPAAISTILGSCVAICLWDAEAKVGGMNHYLLPAAPPLEPDSLRFGSAANERLLAAVVAAGARRPRLKAMVFGGACVVAAFRGRGDDHLGRQNVDVARKFLAKEGIPLVTQDTGGERGRKVAFHTGDGRILVRTL